MIQNVSAISTQGIHDATERLERTATAVARGEGGHATHAVNQITAQVQLQANIAVLEVANEMSGTILDVLV